MHSFSRLLGYRRVPGIGVGGIDFVGLAEGHGVKAWRVDAIDTLYETLDAALAAPYPNLVEMLVGPGQGNVY